MKNYFLAAFCALSGLYGSMHAASWIYSADDITEEWLVGAGVETGYTEHVRHFKQLFSTLQVDTFLEFGVGFSTKYFIDHSRNVISVEFVTPGSGPEWLKYCIDLYKNCTTWQPIAYFTGNGLDTSWAPYKYMGVESVYKAASYQPAYYKSYALIDSSFLADLNMFIGQQVAAHKVDVAFVDAGVCIRGDLVQQLFNKVPVIVAHDIPSKEKRLDSDVYGYGRLAIPSNYVEIHVPFGMGTAFWVKNEPQYRGVIKGLQDYVLKGEKK